MLKLLKEFPKLSLPMDSGVRKRDPASYLQLHYPSNYPLMEAVLKPC